MKTGTTKIKTNFGQINGRRIMTFRVTADGTVPPGWARRDDCDSKWYITAHQSFQRWKIARKAWKTRKYKNQIDLGI